MRVLLILALGTAALAEPAKDVQGWSKVRWGMTETEVIAAFDGKAKYYSGDADEPGVTLQLRDVEIDTVKMTAHFWFDKKTGKLSRVNLRHVKAQEELAQLNFESLRMLLTQKYGEPGFLSAEGIKRVIAWNLPSTTIRLTLWWYPAINFKAVSLTYEERKPQDNL